MSRKRGRLFVISGPSGTGKGTVCKELLKDIRNEFSVSMTTRAPREGEVHGREYYFVSRDEFLANIEAGNFLEHATVFDNLYGTPKDMVISRLDRGYNVILDIDVQGAHKVREYVRALPDTDPLKIGYVDIFINPPSLEELRARLEGRGTDSPEVIEKRLANAEGEMARAGEYMFRVTNDDLAICFKRLCDLIDVLSGKA